MSKSTAQFDELILSSTPGKGYGLMTTSASGRVGWGQTLTGTVNITNPLDNQFLVFDSGTGKWVNESVLPGTIANLEDLDNVTITTPADGQGLIYDSGTGEWVNSTSSFTSIDQAYTTENQFILRDPITDKFYKSSILAIAKEGRTDITSVSVSGGNVTIAQGGLAILTSAVAYYPIFDNDASSTIIEDTIGGIDLTLHDSSAWFNPFGPKGSGATEETGNLLPSDFESTYLRGIGNPQDSIVLSSVSGYRASGPATNLPTTNASRTISFWFYPLDFSETIGRLFTYGTDAAAQWFSIYYYKPASTATVALDINGTTFVSLTPLQLNAWNHITLSASDGGDSDTNVKFVVNGIIEKSLNVAVVMNTASGSTLYINSSDGTERAHGYMVDIVVTNEVMDAAQILALFNGGFAATYLSLSSTVAKVSYNIPASAIVSEGDGLLTSMDTTTTPGVLTIFQGATTVSETTANIVVSGGGRNTSLSVNQTTENVELVDGGGTKTVGRYHIVPANAFKFSFGTLPLSPDFVVIGAEQFKLYSALNPYVWFNNGGNVDYIRTATGPLIFPCLNATATNAAASHATLFSVPSGGFMIRDWEVEVEWERFLSGTSPANKLWASISADANSRSAPYVGIVTRISMLMLNDLQGYVTDVEAVNDDIRADINEATLFTAGAFPTPFSVSYTSGSGSLTNNVKTLLTINNSGVESGAWETYGGPSTLTSYNLIKNNTTADTDSNTFRPVGMPGWWLIGTPSTASGYFNQINPQMQFLGGKAKLFAYQNNGIVNYYDASWTLDVEGTFQDQTPYVSIVGDVGPIQPSAVGGSPQFLLELSYSTRMYVPISLLNSRYFPTVGVYGDTNALIP